MTTSVKKKLTVAFTKTGDDSPFYEFYDSDSFQWGFTTSGWFKVWDHCWARTYSPHSIIYVTEVQEVLHAETDR